MLSRFEENVALSIVDATRMHPGSHFPNTYFNCLVLSSAPDTIVALEAFFPLLADESASGSNRVVLNSATSSSFNTNHFLDL